MSKKLILFLMVLLFGSTSFLRADELTVSDGAGTNSYVPVQGLWADAYLRSQYVVPASQLAVMNGGTINGIKFYLSTPSSAAWSGTFQVYMTEVDYTEIDAFANVADATVVYTGTLDATSAEMTVTFNAPYNYAGGNLLVGVDQIVRGSYSSCAFIGVAVTGASVQGYSSNSLETISPSPRDFMPKTTFVYEPGAPVPPTPPVGGELTITPNTFAMGYRPVNGWMEPLAIKISNTAAPTTITASVSNTAGVNAFAMSQEINEIVLETGDVVDFTIDINRNAPVGEYAEEFTMFSVMNSKDIATSPITATFYTASTADIIETAKTVTLRYTGGVANFSEEIPSNIYANYLLWGMESMKKDAVYSLTIAKDSKFSATAGNNVIALYKKVNNLYPTASMEPIIWSDHGTITEETILAGQYYMIVAGDNLTTVSGTVEQYVAPSALTALTPEDGATGVSGDIILTWEGGANATQYQVLFGTSPVNMTAVLDWTMMDDNFGSYNVTGLTQNNTQYFWQIKAKNSNGTVQTERRGFTTTLTAPNAVTATAEEIFVDGNTLIKWKHNSSAISDLPETQIGSGTTTTNYLPTNNFYNFSFSEQIYTGEEIGGAGNISSISFYPKGNITRNLDIYMVNTDKTSFNGNTDLVPVSAEDLVFSGNVNMVADTWVTIALDSPFLFDGSNLLLVVNDMTGTYTTAIQYSIFNASSQAINMYKDASAYDPTAPSGSATVRDFKNQIILNKNSRNVVDNNRSFLGYNVYYGNVKANTELITEKQYLLSNLPYNMEGHDVSVTAVYNEGESNFSNPVVVKVSGYGKFTGIVTELISGQPVAGATITFEGKDEFNNTVEFSGTTASNGRYTINNVKAGNYRGTATLEGMDPRVSGPVTLAYGATETVDFIIHEEYNPVMSVYASEVDPTMSKVQWSLNYNISGGGGGGNTPTDGAIIKLTIGDVWGDGTGYQMLLDDTHSLYGTTIPTTGALSSSCSGNDAIYNQFSHKIPANADGNCSTSNIVINNSVEITVPAGTYDWCITNPTPGDKIWIASDQGNVGGRYDDYVFESGCTYEFTVILLGQNDATNVTITGAKSMNQPKMAVKSDDNRVNYNNYVASNDNRVVVSETTGSRAVQEYAVYRKAILKETEITDDDYVYFTNVTDTIYADFDWNNVEPGLYQYGISAIYPSPARDNSDSELTVYEGTVTNNAMPMYLFYFDDWTISQYVIPASDLTEMAGSTINAIKFYTTNSNVPYTTVASFELYMTEVDNTTISEFVPKSNSQVVFSGVADFVAEGNGGVVTLTFDTPYTYNGGNLLIGCENTTDAGYKNIYFYGQTVSGASIAGSSGTSTAAVTPVQRNFIPQTTFVYENGGGFDSPVTEIIWSNVLPKDIETTVTVNATVASGSPEGAVVVFTNIFENLVYNETFDETGVVTITDFRKGNYTVTVDLQGYVSNYASTEVSIWDETEINAILSEICKPVDDIVVSVTGYAYWTPVVENGRAAERYFISLDGVFVAETADNSYQFEDLTENEEYTIGVAVVYTTGLSNYVYKTFRYLGCGGVAQQVEELAATSDDMNVTLTWNGGTPTPPTPPTDGAIIKLTIGDVWGDGTGYQMLLDDTHSLYGTTIPTTGALSSSCSGNDAIYNQFSHKIPANADGNCSTSNIVINNSVEITVPAGTYDWCITNPTPGDKIWIASDQGNIGGRYDDYVFESGRTYEFTVILLGQNDATNVTITGGKGMNQPKMAVKSDDNRTANFFANTNINIMSAGEGFGAAANQLTRDWYYYDNGVNVDAIGLQNGGTFWWGVMFPAGQYEGTQLTKVSLYDYAAHTGNIYIYSGGTSAPGSQIGTTTYTCTGSNDFIEVTFAEPVTVDPNQNLWVVLSNNSGQYVAACCNNTGDANGRWISTDGSTWMDVLAASSSLNYTWMIRAFVEAGGPGPVPGGIVPNKYNIELDGEIVGSTANRTFTLQAPDTEVHTYTVYYVDANYGISCPMSIEYQVGLGVIEHEVVNSIYPNPTSGDLYINAMNMTHISIVNTMGQVVYEQNVSGNETKVDMAKFEAGVYMVNINTENGSSVKRVTVVK